jgi:hypothetical protein
MVGEKAEEDLARGQYPSRLKSTFLIGLLTQKRGMSLAKMGENGRGVTGKQRLRIKLES